MLARLLGGVLPTDSVDLGAIMTDSDHDPALGQLKNLGKRLDNAVQARGGGNKTDTKESSAAGLAMRAVTELLVGLLVTMVGGYFIDKYLGTAPWFMIALMPVGLAAGVMNVMRLSNSKQAKEILGDGLSKTPAVKLDDDED